MSQNFQYDMNADFDNIMQGKSQGTAMAKAAGNVPPGKQGAAGGKKEPWMDVPEPGFIKQTDLTISVPVGDPDREQMQVVKDDGLLQHHEQDIKGRIYECRK